MCFRKATEKRQASANSGTGQVSRNGVLQVLRGVQNANKRSTRKVDDYGSGPEKDIDCTSKKLGALQGIQEKKSNVSV